MKIAARECRLLIADNDAISFGRNSAVRKSDKCKIAVDANAAASLAGVVFFSIAFSSCKMRLIVHKRAELCHL